MPPNFRQSENFSWLIGQLWFRKVTRNSEKNREAFSLGSKLENIVNKRIKKEKIWNNHHAFQASARNQYYLKLRMLQTLKIMLFVYVGSERINHEIWKLTNLRSVISRQAQNQAHNHLDSWPVFLVFSKFRANYKRKMPMKIIAETANSIRKYATPVGCVWYFANFIFRYVIGSALTNHNSLWFSKSFSFYFSLLW